MKFVAKSKRIACAPFPSTKVFEYEMREEAIGFGLAEIDGRYPEQGFVSNRIVKELVYIVAGEGRILRPGEEETAIAAGDVVLFGPHERYAWEGRLTLAMATAPRFDPAQHERHDAAD